MIVFTLSFEKQTKVWMLHKGCACAFSEGDRGVSFSAMTLNSSHVEGAEHISFHLQCYDWLVYLISRCQTIAVVPINSAEYKNDL